MTREEALSKTWGMMCELQKDCTRDKINEIFDFVCNWNDEHEDETEIFMCEEYDDNKFRLYLEDDYVEIEDF